MKMYISPLIALSVYLNQHRPGPDNSTYLDIWASFTSPLGVTSQNVKETFLSAFTNGILRVNSGVAYVSKYLS